MNGQAGNNERPQEGKEGFVYIIHALETTRIKIGFSFEPAERLGVLQTASPFLLVLIGTCPGSFSLERQMHDRLKDHRCIGEWFEFDPQEALKLLKQISKAEERELSVFDLPNRILQAVELARTLQLRGTDPECKQIGAKIEELLKDMPRVMAAAAEQLAEVA